MSDGGLRKIFRTHLPAVAWSTIETGTVEPGVPDLNGCHGGIEFWVECKATTGWAVEVKKSQVAWHLLRASKWGRTFFAVRQLGAGRDDFHLIEGRHAIPFFDAGLREVPTLFHCAGGPAKWEWGRILKLLTTVRPP